MIKSGTVKSVLLLALIGMIIVGLVQPIAGSTTGQDSSSGMKKDSSSTGKYSSSNESCPSDDDCDDSVNKTTMPCMMMDDDSVNKTMMPCMMMGDDSVNKTMMHFIVCDCMMFESMMDDDSVNKTMMPCMMMGDDSVNKTMMPCMMMDDDSVNKTMMPCMMMDDDSVNKTMMPCMMMGDHLSNESCCIIKMDQNASSAQAEMECAHLWLKKAMMMHHMHMKDPSTATNESQMEMMHHMMQAYECMTGENMTMEMIEETAYDGSAGWMDATVDDGSADYRSTNNGSAGC